MICSLKKTPSQKCLLLRVIAHSQYFSSGFSIFLTWSIKKLMGNSPQYFYGFGWNINCMLLTLLQRASQMALVIKNPTANARDIKDAGLIPGLGRSPGGGHDNPLQYSCLENPMDTGAWRATVHEIPKGYNRSDTAPVHHYTERKTSSLRINRAETAHYYMGVLWKMYLFQGTGLFELRHWKGSFSTLMDWPVLKQMELTKMKRRKSTAWCMNWLKLKIWKGLKILPSFSRLHWSFFL